MDRKPATRGDEVTGVSSMPMNGSPLIGCTTCRGDALEGQTLAEKRAMPTLAKKDPSKAPDIKQVSAAGESLACIVLKIARQISELINSLSKTPKAI